MAGKVRTFWARLTGCCLDCGKDARCREHTRFKLDAYDPDDHYQDSPMVSCGACVVQYGTALGSITHICITIEERLAGAIAQAGSPEALVEQALAATRPKEPVQEIQS